MATERLRILDSISNVDVVDGKLKVKLTGSVGGGHTIQDDGVSLTQRTNLNFIGAGVSDDSVNDATKVNIGVLLSAGQYNVNATTGLLVASEYVA